MASAAKRIKSKIIKEAAEVTPAKKLVFEDPSVTSNVTINLDDNSRVGLGLKQRDLTIEHEFDNPKPVSDDTFAGQEIDDSP
jgi:hypothetical protein